VRRHSFNDLRDAMLGFAAHGGALAVYSVPRECSVLGCPRRATTVIVAVHRAEISMHPTCAGHGTRIHNAINASIAAQPTDQIDPRHGAPPAAIDRVEDVQVDLATAVRTSEVDVDRFEGEVIDASFDDEEPDSMYPDTPGGWTSIGAAIDVARKSRDGWPLCSRGCGAPTNFGQPTCGREDCGNKGGAS